MSEISGEFEFDATFAGQVIDLTWVEEYGWLSEGRELAAVVFTADAGRCWATLKIDETDEAGYVQRVNYEWPDTDANHLEALEALLEAGQKVRVWADDEHNGDVWWPALERAAALDEDLADLPNGLRKGGVEVTQLVLSKLKRLPGFDGGPKHAPHPLLWETV